MTKTLGIVLAAGKGSRMKSDLPKVLHEVNGIPMVVYCIETLKAAGASAVVVVVGYKGDMIRERLGDSVGYAVQTVQNGTGSAAVAAQAHFVGYERVAVINGDNPLLSVESVASLIGALDDSSVAASLLSIVLDNPAAAGRIIRNDHGHFIEVIEERDCTSEQKNIRELNAGAYCFRTQQLIDGLSQLTTDNAQGEYYLTDVPGIIAKNGSRVEVITSDNPVETLGINDRHHLQFAESLRDIHYAESLYPVIDAALALGWFSNE